MIMFLCVLSLCLSAVLSTTSNSDGVNCYRGSYEVKLPPFNDCSGFRDCEVGHYCQSGKKYSCPAGTFGSLSGLSNSSCSGLCNKGFYCPDGSTTATPKFCGNSSLYCPTGSGAPITAPIGYYTTDSNGNDYKDSETTRVNITICPAGSYCINGLRSYCPSGVYGLDTGLSDAQCSGVCPEGWFCPSGSQMPFSRPCKRLPTEYCPQGVDHPHLTESGYYAVNSHISEGGGYGQSVVCPRGSFCIQGERHDCPAGRYGSTIQMTNSSCTGLCTAGYYCPLGSTNSTQIQCDSTNQYCPAGSTIPIAVSTGHYSIGHAKHTSTTGNLFLHQANVNQSLCEQGNYCLKDGIKRPCPAGRYGSSYGISNRDCDGPCALGHYCPEGSSSVTQYSCGDADDTYPANLFCPPGSAAPQTVHTGYYSVQGDDDYTRGSERRCEPGFFCAKGVKHLCAGGYYGADYGEIVYTCSGLCSPGYYCPQGSISSKEIMCGDASRYCPGAMDSPTNVDRGYYYIGGNDSTRTSQVIAPPGHYAINGLLYVCPAGYYGATSGLYSATCSGLCQIPGYYCPTGSISPVMRYCGGDNVYCPANIVAPLRVHAGFYTADYMYEVCPPGQWRNSTIRLGQIEVDPYGPIPTVIKQFDCQLCPVGTYKSVVGDSHSLCRKCEAVYTNSTSDRIMCACRRVVDSEHVPLFNPVTGACDIHPINDLALSDASKWASNTSLTRYEQFPCEPGHYCVNGLRYKCPEGRYGEREQETDSQCTGICAAGYYCLKASTSPYSYQCGSAEWICATGSDTPVRVPAGYYSNENAPESLRSGQLICPVGHYCPGDGRRYQCSPGTYTDTLGTISAECMGVCDKGHYCTAASPSKTQFICGNATVYCPRGSSSPSPVHDGFYTYFTGVNAGEQALWDTANSTASAEIPCEPGYYCSKGVKQPCPPGTFGWRYGMTNSTCGGKCAAGYYCPSYLLPQPGAPAYTLWPLKPHTIAATPDFECGGVNYYCPVGTYFPHRVGGGNYSYGGDSNNRTRHGQAVCSPGSYCKNSISILCPPGRYGSTYGLADSTCTAGCPAGFYCPAGSAQPIQCPLYQYSTGLVAVCSTCPGGRTSALPCQNEKGCCFRT